MTNATANAETALRVVGAHGHEHFHWMPVALRMQQTFADVLVQSIYGRISGDIEKRVHSTVMEVVNRRTREQMGRALHAK